MTSPEGLDLDAVVPWLRERGLIGGGDVEASRLAGGLSNVTYLVTQGETSLVIRRPPLGHVMPTAHDMGREFTVLSGMARGGFRAPKPLAFCDDESVNGARFLVMEYVPGRILSSDAAAEGLSAQDAGVLSAELMDTVAELHNVDAAAVGLGEFGKPEGFLARQVGRWRQQWELSKTRDLPEIESLATWLDERVATIPVGAPWSVVHGDYRLDNCIVDPVDPRVRAVLDWEMSTLGDPISDLAVMLVYWTDADDTLRSAVPVAQHITDRPGFWTRSQLVDRYAEYTGRSLDHLDFCSALACFKLAVIMESILARSLQGQQLGTGAGEVDAMRQSTEALTVLGLRVLDEGAIAGLGS